MKEKESPSPGVGMPADKFVGVTILGVVGIVMIIVLVIAVAIFALGVIAVTNVLAVALIGIALGIFLLSPRSFLSKKTRAEAGVRLGYRDRT